MHPDNTPKLYCTGILVSFILRRLSRESCVRPVQTKLQMWLRSNTHIGNMRLYRGAGAFDFGLKTIYSQLPSHAHLFVLCALQDQNEGLHAPALESIRAHIRSATSSMTSVPKPLKFLRPHFDRIKTAHEAYTNQKNKVCCWNHEPASCFWHLQSDIGRAYTFDRLVSCHAQTPLIFSTTALACRRFHQTFCPFCP
jgi:hypothetical protein